MEMDIGLSKQVRTKLYEGFDQILADTYALYLKTQGCHWNIRGPRFYSLHLLFETHYKELAEAVDEIAERMGALGFSVHASFSSFKEKTSIREDKKVLKAGQMIASLIQGHESLVVTLRKFVTFAEQEKDAGSVDLLGRRLLSHEKMAWFLRSHV